MVYVVMCIYETAGELEFSVAGNLNAAIKTANHYVNQLISNGFKADKDWDADPFLAENKTFKIFVGKKGSIVKVYFREKEVLSH